MPTTTWDAATGVPAPDGVKQFITRPFADRPVAFLPGVRSDSEQAVRLYDRLATALSTVLVPSGESPFGLYWPGVPAGLDRLYTAQGVNPRPAGTPWIDATILAKQVATGRSDYDGPGWTPLRSMRVSRYAQDLQLSDREKRIIDFVTRSFLVMPERAPSVPLNRLSTVGVPYMTRSLDTKMKIGSQWIRERKTIRKLIEATNFRGLYEKGIIHTYFNGYRYQQDRTVKRGNHVVSPKERTVFTWDEIVTTMDKTITSGPAAGRLVASRTRSFAAASLSGSFGHRVLARAVELMMYMLFPRTMKHRGVEDIISKTERYVAMRLFDVTQHDQTLNTYFIDSMYDRIGTVASSWAAESFIWNIRAPLLAHNDTVGGKGASMRGNPFSLTGFTAWYPNASGNPWTSVIAKIGGVSYAIMVLVELGLAQDDEKDWLQLLQGNHPRCGFLNMGDNLALGVTDPRDESLLDESVAALYCAELDRAESFIGFVPTSVGSTVTWLPNILSYVIKWFGHDRDVGPPYRTQWASGWFARQAAYRDHPLYGEAASVVNAVCLAELGSTMDDIARFHQRREVAPPVLRSALDLEFIMNPDIIHYRADIADISPELIEDAFVTFSSEQLQPLYNHLLGKE